FGLRAHAHIDALTVLGEAGDPLAADQVTNGARNIFDAHAEGGGLVALRANSNLRTSFFVIGVDVFKSFVFAQARFKCLHQFNDLIPFGTADGELNGETAASAESALR